MKEKHETSSQSFYRALLDTAFGCGMKIISDDFCCKLLAWVYVFGGGDETVVKNEKLYSEICYAQKRLNIQGSEVCNAELLPVLKQRIKECGDWSKPLYPDWIKEIDNRYEIKTL